MLTLDAASESGRYSTLVVLGVVSPFNFFDSSVLRRTQPHNGRLLATSHHQQTVDTDHDIILHPTRFFFSPTASLSLSLPVASVRSIQEPRRSCGIWVCAAEARACVSVKIKCTSGLRDHAVRERERERKRRRLVQTL